MMRELDCFELKTKNQTEKKATQSWVRTIGTNNQVLIIRILVYNFCC